MDAGPVSLGLILDCSASMWNRLEDGRYRIDAAKQVLTDFVSSLPEDGQQNIGLRIYGSKIHFSKPGACQDSELVVPIEGFERAKILEAVRSARAVGATPLAKSLELAAGDFQKPGKRRLIVFTDGEESCGGNVAAAIESLRARGVEVDVRLIGIGLPPAAVARFEALGVPVENASTLKQLATAFENATSVGSGAKEKAAEAPAPKPVEFVVKAIADGAPFTGASIFFERESDGSRVALEPVSEGVWKGSALPGSYRGGNEDGSKVWRNLPLVPSAADAKPQEFSFDFTVPPQVRITPESLNAFTAQPLRVKFEGAKGNERDYLTIVPVDSEQDTGPSWQTTGGKSAGEVELITPGQPVPVEVRYYAQLESGSVLAGKSAPISLSLPTVKILAPDSIPASSSLVVGYEGAAQAGNHFYLRKEGSKDGEYLSYRPQPPDASETVTFTSPPDPGTYEIALANDLSPETPLAVKKFEVTEAGYAIEVPASAPAGSRVAVKWQGPRGEGIFLTIVEKNAEDGTWLDYLYLSDAGEEVLLNTPRTPGAAEIRIVSEAAQGRVLLRRELQLTQPSLTLQAPTTIPASAQVDIEWSSAPAGGGDYITIVKQGAEEGSYDSYFYVETPQGKGSMNAPEAVGQYEIRYVTGDGKTIKSVPLNVTH
jgi:Ca-activated chloride channel family protein